jgi:hypothetical protein
MSNHSIQLQLVNRSNDHNNVSYIIFQHNKAPGFTDTALAWMVVSNLGIGDNHPFSFPCHLDVAASDSWGNYTPWIPAETGQMFQMVRTPSGDQLIQKGNALNGSEIDMMNSLEQGSINTHCYRSGKKLYSYIGLPPKQRAAFQFDQTIFMAAFLGIAEGEIMDANLLSQLDATAFSLLGIASADIVITGGGIGPSAEPFKFTLDHVVHA